MARDGGGRDGDEWQGNGGGREGDEGGLAGKGIKVGGDGYEWGVERVGRWRAWGVRALGVRYMARRLCLWSRTHQDSQWC